MYTHCISRELRLHMMSAALTLATASYILCFFTVLMLSTGGMLSSHLRSRNQTPDMKERMHSF